MDFFNSIPTHMDFDGQARAENLSRIIVVLFGVVGLIWGYIIQQFSQTVYILGAGLVLATDSHRSSMATLSLETIELAKSKTRSQRNGRFEIKQEKEMKIIKCYWCLSFKY